MSSCCSIHELKNFFTFFLSDLVRSCVIVCDRGRSDENACQTKSMRFTDIPISTMKNLSSPLATMLALSSMFAAMPLSAAPGWAMEKFNNVGGPAISNLTTAASFYSAPSPTVLTSSAIPSNTADNYGTRIRGYIIPPVTGDYIFWESGNAAVQVFLSPDDNPASKQLIATHSGGTGIQEWTKFPSQQSRPLPLVAGRKYYIEALHKAGTGADHLAIAWTAPGASRSLIPLSAMETYEETVPTTSPGLTQQAYSNIAGGSIADLMAAASYPHSPSSINVLTTGQAPSNAGEKYGSRTRGWIVPQTSGSYTFWISGDDSMQLYLSPSSNPGDKQMIAHSTLWTSPLQWTKYAVQKSRVLTLTAGKAYYMEILHAENTGTDHLAVAWTPPGGALEILPNSVLRTWAPHPSDLDDDLIADAQEPSLGLDPANSADGYADSDNDVIPNFRDYAQFSLPTVLDSVYGHLNDDIWFNVPGGKLYFPSYKAAATRPMDFRTYLTGAQSADVGENYIRRYRGYITAPVTGAYQFWLTADDDGDLYLSTTASKFDMVPIIRSEVVGGEVEFDLHPSQKSALITLQAGQKYYIEMWHKEALGSGNAAIAWKAPNSSREIIPARYLSSFAGDADDLDDDDLPDSYEIANGLNPNDNGRSLGSADGAYGDLDGDGLTNREEWKNNTKANLIDSDGDGVSDLDEVNFFGSAALANDIGAFTTVATIPGDAHIVSTGTWDNFAGKARQDSRRGSVTYAITAPSNGIYATRFTLTSILDGGKSEEYQFEIKLNGQRIAYKTIFISPDGTSTLSLLTPWLEAGQNYNLELFVDNSYNFRRISVDQLELLAPGGTDSNSNGTPDWTEIRVNDFNGLDQTTHYSKTSPAVIEGKARFLGLVTTNAPALIAAPNGRFFTEVPLTAANAGSATNLSFSFENNGLSQSTDVYWLPTNLKVENTLTIRQGDSLLLTAFVDAENASLESYTYTLNGNTISNTADQPKVQLFPTAGNYALQLSHTAADGTITNRSITVKVLPKITIEPPVCVVGHPRSWTPTTLPAGSILTFDSQMQSEVGPAAGTYSIATMTPHNQPIIAKSAGGLIQGGSHVKSCTVRAGALTGNLFSNVTVTEAMVDIYFVVYGDMGGSVITCDLFQGGVTFVDGTLSSSLASVDFDVYGVSKMRTRKLHSAHAVCHRVSVWENGLRIANFN